MRGVFLLVISLSGSMRVDTREEILGEVIDRIRGEPGSMVSLEVERPITAEEHSFELGAASDRA